MMQILNKIWLPGIIYAAFIVFLVYFLLLVAFYIIMAIWGFIEDKKRAYEQEEESYPLMYFSNIKIPVSILLPAHNEEEWVKDSLSSVLNLNYPTFEVIVIDDGSTDNTFKILDEMLDLKAIDRVVTKHYQEGNVKGIFESHKYPNVTVIQKESDNKKAGALNAGLNIAKHRFICAMDSDTVLERDALLWVMAPVHRDPERIIGIGSCFGLVNGFEVKNGIIMKRNFSYKPVIAYQNLEYIRSFIGNRLAWSSFNVTPIVAGGFGIWRSDVLYELGGYSSEFSSEDLDFTFRAHEYLAAHKDKKYKILVMPYYVGWTEGPDNIKALIKQRDRWQRVTNEAIFRYKHMMCNPKYGSFGFLVFPYFLFYEVLGGFFEMASVFFVTMGWLTGLMDIKTFLVFIAFMTLVQVLISLLSLFSFIRGKKTFKTSYVLYLIVLSFFEFFVYRFIISIAKLFGTYHYFRKVQTHDQFARSKRG